MLIDVVVARLIYYGRGETHHIMATHEDLLRTRSQVLQDRVREHEAHIVQLNTELDKMMRVLEDLKKNIEDAEQRLEELRKDAEDAQEELNDFVVGGWSTGPSSNRFDC